MRKIGLFVLTSVLVLIGSTSRALAWGSKEHIQLTRLVVERICDDPTAPADLKAWLKLNTPDIGTIDQERNYFLTAHVGIDDGQKLTGFSFWVIQPDVRAGADSKMEKDKLQPPLREPLGVPERYWHFLDMEYLNADVDKRAYHHDLSTAPDITQAPRDIKDERYKESGVLPFAIEASYKELVKHLQAGKLNPPVDKPRDDDNALKWASFLLHYNEDNTQPLHGTQDYKCASYFENRLKAPNVHSQVEYEMNDNEKHDYPKLRSDYWKLFEKALKTQKDPVGTDDLWMNSLQVSTANYKTIPLIGLAAMAATGEGGTPDAPKGKWGPFDTEKFFRFKSNVLGGETSYMEVKAKQQAWAVVRGAALIRKAWDEAHQKN